MVLFQMQNPGFHPQAKCSKSLEVQFRNLLSLKVPADF
jgi:hypothetical protein